MRGHGCDFRSDLKDHPTPKLSPRLKDALLIPPIVGRLSLTFLGSDSTRTADDKTGRICRGATGNRRTGEAFDLLGRA